MRAQVLFKASVLAAVMAALPGAPVLAACWPKTEASAQRVIELQSMLNVAGLQCRFDPALKVLDNYNLFIADVRPQFMGQLRVLESRFRRLTGKRWQSSLDRHRTAIFNSYSTVNDQVPFCRRSSEILTEAVLIKPVDLRSFADRTMSVTNVALTPCPPPAKKAVRKKRT